MVVCNPDQLPGVELDPLLVEDAFAALYRATDAIAGVVAGASGMDSECRMAPMLPTEAHVGFANGSGEHVYVLELVGGARLVWTCRVYREDGTHELHELIPGAQTPGGGVFYRRVHFSSDPEDGPADVIGSSVLAGSHLTPANYLLHQVLFQ